MKKSNSKIWGGRFLAPTDEIMEEFNSSIQFDKILYMYSINYCEDFFYGQLIASYLNPIQNK